MMPHSTSQLRPRRAGHEKSRTGCLTCKIRRVKCDETIPSCLKCTESGRKCEGPLVRQFRFIRDQPISRSTTQTPQLEVSLLAPQHSEDERRAFHYFTHHAAPVFAGAVDASFWKDLVPRLAQTYSFVWDTVVCVSSLLEHVPYTSLTTTFNSTDPNKVTNREHRQALRFYNRAIVSVRQLAERDQMDDSMVALSYILFASVEFQQRNVKTGTDLVKRCCKILTENVTSLCTRPNSTAGQAVHQVVTPFVLRKAVVIATLGSALPLQWVANNKSSNMIKAVLSRSPTLNEARVLFYSLVHHSYELIRLADFVPNIKEDDPDKALFMSQRQSLMDKLMQWKASFTATRNETLDVETDWIASYLLMYWAVCYTTLAACLSPRQTIFDHYMDYFAEIVEHATVYLRHSAQSTKVQLPSNLEPGVIPPLYFCATKCRDPNLRRQALRLMRQAPRQENLWAFIAPDRVVAKVILVEEGEYHQLSCLSKGFPASQYTTTGLPPEERRFAYASVVGRQTPGGRQRQALELSRFEFATDGSRRLINDYVWLDDGEEEEVWPDARRESPVGMVTRNTMEMDLGMAWPNLADQGEHESKGGLTRIVHFPLIAGRLSA